MFHDNKLILEKEDAPLTAESFFPFVDIDGEYELFKLIINKEQYGWLCLEYRDNKCVLHLHIKENHRTKKKIMHLVKGFTEVVHPWVKNKGASQIIVQCDYRDKKTMELFVTFGFVPIWMGIMEV